MNCGTQVSLSKICDGCGTAMPAQAAFCGNCGKSAKEPPKPAVCPNCKEVSETPVFCGKCGYKFGVTVLGNEHLIELNNIFYDKLLKTLEVYNDAIDLHSMVSILHPPKLKQDYIQSVNGCFDYLTASAGDALAYEHKAYIQGKKNAFLTTESENLFIFLTELDKQSALILHTIPPESGSMLGGFLKNAANGYLNPVGSIAKLFTGDDKRQERIVEDYDKARNQVLEEIDKLWENFCDLLDEIAENTAIQFDIDEEKLVEQMTPEENPIETILVNHLKKEGDDGNGGYYFYQDIPAKKKAAAKGSYVKNLDEDEKIICLYDSTLFGGAKDGICFTTKGMYWKELWEDGNFICYGDMKKCTIIDKNKDGELGLFVNDMRVDSCDKERCERFKNAITEIIEYTKIKGTIPLSPQVSRR
jgi:hypothetical protein